MVKIAFLNFYLFIFLHVLIDIHSLMDFLGFSKVKYSIFKWSKFTAVIKEPLEDLPPYLCNVIFAQSIGKMKTIAYKWSFSCSLNYSVVCCGWDHSHPGRHCPLQGTKMLLLLFLNHRINLISQNNFINLQWLFPAENIYKTALSYIKVV